MAERILTANQIFNEQKRFSIILKALEPKHVKTLQNVIRKQQLTRLFSSYKTRINQNTQN